MLAFSIVNATFWNISGEMSYKFIASSSLKQSKWNFRFVTSGMRNLIAPFCFRCAKRCKFYGATFESNFIFCDFICCFSKVNILYSGKLKRKTLKADKT